MSGDLASSAVGSALARPPRGWPVRCTRPSGRIGDLARDVGVDRDEAEKALVVAERLARCWFSHCAHGRDVPTPNATDPPPVDQIHV